MFQYILVFLQQRFEHIIIGQGMRQLPGGLQVLWLFNRRFGGVMVHKHVSFKFCSLLDNIVPGEINPGMISISFRYVWEIAVG